MMHGQTKIKYLLYFNLNHIINSKRKILGVMPLLHSASDMYVKSTAKYAIGFLLTLCKIRVSNLVFVCRIPPHIVGKTVYIHSNKTSHLHHHLPPWIRSFDLFRHRRVAIVSWGVHDLFFLWVCSSGRVSLSLALSILSRWLIHFCLYLDLTSCIPGISSSSPNSKRKYMLWHWSAPWERGKGQSGQ